MNSGGATRSSYIQLGVNATTKGVLGVVGSAGTFITGSQVNDVVLYAVGGSLLFSGDNGTQHGQMTTAGAWTLGPSGATTVKHYIQGQTAGDYLAVISENTGTAGNSRGLLVQAGTNSSDFVQVWKKKDATTVGTLTGAGIWTLGDIALIGGATFPGNKIMGKQDASAVAAGYIGESSEATGSATSMTTATFMTGGNSGLTLTPGVWDIQAVGNFSPGATTTIGQVVCAIGTASGTSTTSIDDDRNSFVVSYNNGVLNSQFIHCTPMWRVNISSSTTYYPKYRAAFGTSTLTCNGTIRARRVG
jgi:hypothetical protein